MDNFRVEDVRSAEANGSSAGGAGKMLAEGSLPPLEKAITIVRFLRSSMGCAWDREQSFDSIKRHTLEEVYEVFDAIERRSWGDLRDELGDLLLQVLFYAQMAEEAGYFGITDVAAALNAKLVRRHPHVFVDVTDINSEDVLRNWELIKQEEKRATGRSEGLLNDVPRSTPAILEASRLGKRAAQVGFDWSNSEALLEKVSEELEEVRFEVHASEKSLVRLEEELGDVLFTAVNLARHLKVDAESALRSANAKFRRRFSAMEDEIGGSTGDAALTSEEWNQLWLLIKAREAGTP